jgi:hypothetical protein
MKTISEIVAHMIQAHNSGKKFDVEKLKVQMRCNASLSDNADIMHF